MKGYIPMAKRKNRRRKPGEVATRKEAIRNMCMECMGYEMSEIRLCTAKECWLYPWRLGALDDASLQEEKKQVKASKEDKKPPKTTYTAKKMSGFKFKKP